jgi:hypothetical protein
MLEASSTRSALLDRLYLFLGSDVTLFPRYSRHDLVLHQRNRLQAQTGVPNILIIPRTFALCYWSQESSTQESLKSHCEENIHSQTEHFCSVLQSNQ